MNLTIEIAKFTLLSLGIVIIAKYLLVPVLRKISQILNLGPKASGNIAGFATSVPELLTVAFSAAAGFIGTGVFILGVVCFISSQVSLSIIALGISIAITSIAFGGIILIIFSALIKWVIELVRKYKSKK